MEDYIDLTDASVDLENYRIESNGYNCTLRDDNQNYKGFLLAKSELGNAYTVCDVDFHYSDTDKKYPARLTFHRTNANLQAKAVRKDMEYATVAFQGGDDGYREFWKMISFLYKFNEVIDLGDFHGSYQVISGEQLKEYMNNSSNAESITAMAEELGVEVSELLRTRSTLKLLKSYRDKLKDFVDSGASETEVQNWLDEDNHKYRQQRCMIFGLEYIDFRREGAASSKRFDVLTRVGSKHIDHVLIELKSPSDDMFNIDMSDTINYPTGQYKINDPLARAIPQILEYKSILEDKSPGDPDLERLGIQNKAYIGKCIVVIGKHSDDSRWLQNRKNLVKSLGSTLEIWTYTELLDKLNSTIENLERIKEDEDNEEDPLDWF